MTEPTITQADRNSAIRLLEVGGQDWQAKEIRLGDGDHFPIVQAFAAHREAAVAELRAEVERWWKAYNIAHDQAMHNGSDLHRLRTALRDAINSPKGVVPDSAMPFYKETSHDD